MPSNQNAKKTEGQHQTASKEGWDFSWSNYAFRDGEAENKRILGEFEDKYNALVKEADDEFGNEALLMKGLDLAVAFIKNYELDKAEALYEKLLPQARAQGLPLIAKALQDLATLRFKQNRQADGAVFLEELRDMMPPHPTIYHNLGTTYNSLRRHEEALKCFQCAIKLKEEMYDNYEMDYSDYWDLGLAYKNLARSQDAIDNIEKAYELCPKDDTVMLAKVHDSLGSAYLESGQCAKAQREYSAGLDLFLEALGEHSPLVGTAAEMLAKAYIKDTQNAPKSLESAKGALRIALKVQAQKDAIHPTPLYEIVDSLFDVHMKTKSTKDLSEFHPMLDQAWEKLKEKDLASDANAGLVRHRMALIYLFSGNDHAAQALPLLLEAKELISTGPPELVQDLLCAVEEHIAAYLSMVAPPEK